MRSIYKDYCKENEPLFKFCINRMSNFTLTKEMINYIINKMNNNDKIRNCWIKIYSDSFTINCESSISNVTYSIDIYYSDESRINYYLNLLLDRIQTDINNELISSIYKENDYLLGLLKLTTQHKEIYESSNKIYEGFVEQAGSYKDVVKNFEALKDLKFRIVDKEVNRLKGENLNILNKYNIDLDMIKVQNSLS